MKLKDSTGPFSRLCWACSAGEGQRIMPDGEKAIIVDAKIVDDELRLSSKDYSNSYSTVVVIKGDDNNRIEVILDDIEGKTFTEVENLEV